MPDSYQINIEPCSLIVYLAMIFSMLILFIIPRVEHTEKYFLKSVLCILTKLN